MIQQNWKRAEKNTRHDSKYRAVSEQRPLEEHPALQKRGDSGGTRYRSAKSPVGRGDEQGLILLLLLPV